MFTAEFARDDAYCARVDGRHYRCLVVRLPGVTFRERIKRVGVHENGVVTTVAEAYLSVLKDRGVSRCS